MRKLAALLLFLPFLAAPGLGAEAPDSAPVDLAARTFARPGGETLGLSALQGRPVLINFWAAWCPACREELPLLAKVHARYGKRLAFVGVAVDDNLELTGEFAKAYKVPYPVAGGKETAIAFMQALGNGKALMPFTVILNAEGRTVFSKAGAVSEKELVAALKALPRVP